MSNALAMDRLRCALASAIRTLGDAYCYAWHREPRILGRTGNVRVELVLGDWDDAKTQVRAPFDRSLRWVESSAPGELEVALRQAYAGLLEEQRRRAAC